MFTKTLLNTLYFTGLDNLVAPYTQGIGSIWMLHRVNNSASAPFSPNSHLSISPEFLDLAILQSKLLGHKFVSLDEIIGHLIAGEKADPSEKMIAITLDDAYRDNLENAVPVFRRHEVPYTIFVAPGLVDATHTLWWEDLERVIACNKKITFKIDGKTDTVHTASVTEKRAAFSNLMKCLCNDVNEDEQRESMEKLSREYGHDATGYVKDQIMDWGELDEVARDPLSTLGAHTIGHYALARLEKDRARREIEESRDRLEKLTGGSVDHFAYPYGYASAAGPREFSLARELGFRSAVTTCHGVVYPQARHNLHNIARISINGNFQSLRYLRPMLSGVTTRLNSILERRNAA